MGQNNRGLFERIGAAEHITPTEHRIADYFFKDYPDLAFKDLAQMCEESGASTASVTRFVRKLGYEDFKDFSQSIRNEIKTGFDRPTNRPGLHSASTSDKPGGELISHLRVAQDEIAQTLDSFSETEFDAIADLLADESRPVYLTAFATGRSIITYFYLMMKYQRGNVYLIPSPDMAIHELVDVDKNTVLLATNFDRHPQTIMRSLEIVKKRGGTTALITNRPSTPLRRYADHILLVQTLSSSRFKSRATMLIALEALLSAVESRNPKRTAKRTTQMEQVNDELGLFIHPESTS